MQYIIVQAGGRGSRLETLTTNKPKALVPVDNLPMIFHLFNRYPDAKFKIIADYHKDTFKRYLKAFAKVDYEVIEASKKGTCSGIQDCLKSIPDNTPFMLIWCDLVLSQIQLGGYLMSIATIWGFQKIFHVVGHIRITNLKRLHLLKMVLQGCLFSKIKFKLRMFQKKVNL